MRKSTINYQNYYNIAYLGEILENDDDNEEILESRTDEKLVRETLTNSH